jgi:hypothetical protein
MESKHQHKPVSVELLRGLPPKLAGRIDVDHDGEDEVVYSHPASYPNKQHISVFSHINRGYRQEFYGDT